MLCRVWQQFFARADDDSESDDESSSSSSASSSSSSEDEKPTRGASRAQPQREERRGPRKVISQKDKRFEEMTQTIKQLKNAIKINDWNAISNGIAPGRPLFRICRLLSYGQVKGDVQSSLWAGLQAGFGLWGCDRLAAVVCIRYHSRQRRAACVPAPFMERHIHRGCIRHTFTVYYSYTSLQDT